MINNTIVYGNKNFPIDVNLNGNTSVEISKKTYDNIITSFEESLKITPIFKDTGNVQKFSWANDKLFLSTDGSSDTTSNYVSDDGLHWKALNIYSSYQSYFSDVYYHQNLGLYIQMKNISGTAQILSSEDGITWEKDDFRISSPAAFAVNNNGNACVFSTNKSIYYTTKDPRDRNNWLNSKSTDVTALDLIFPVPEKIKTFIATKASTVYYTVSGGIYFYDATIDSSANPQGSIIKGFACGDSGILIVVFQNGILYAKNNSYSGTWKYTSFGSNIIQDAFYANGMVVVLTNEPQSNIYYCKTDNNFGTFTKYNNLGEYYTPNHGSGFFDKFICWNPSNSPYIYSIPWREVVKVTYKEK